MVTPWQRYALVGRSTPANSMSLLSVSPHIAHIDWLLLWSLWPTRNTQNVVGEAQLCRFSITVETTNRRLIAVCLCLQADSKLSQQHLQVWLGIYYDQRACRPVRDHWAHGNDRWFGRLSSIWKNEIRCPVSIIEDHIWNTSELIESEGMMENSQSPRQEFSRKGEVVRSTTKEYPGSWSSHSNLYL